MLLPSPNARCYVRTGDWGRCEGDWVGPGKPYHPHLQNVTLLHLWGLTQDRTKWVVSAVSVGGQHGGHGLRGTAMNAVALWWHAGAHLPAVRMPQVQRACMSSCPRSKCSVVRKLLALMRAAPSRGPNDFSVLTGVVV